MLMLSVQTFKTECQLFNDRFQGRLNTIGSSLSRDLWTADLPRRTRPESRGQRSNNNVSSQSRWRKVSHLSKWGGAQSQG